LQLAEASRTDPAEYKFRIPFSFLLTGCQHTSCFDKQQIQRDISTGYKTFKLKTFVLNGADRGRKSVN